MVLAMTFHCSSISIPLENRERFFTTLPVRRNVDAVFVASFAVDSREVEQLKRIRVPIVGINTPGREDFDATVCIDDDEGMMIATQHLINLGHKYIVYICSRAADSLNASIDARRQGFIHACQTAETSHDLHWKVLEVPRDGGYADSALASLLALDQFPDAICCQTDTIAIPLIVRLERYDKLTPRDYSIIGFDDSQYADIMNLTTMKQDPFLMGRKAAHKALTLINGETLGQPHEIMHARLTLRETDAPVQLVLRDNDRAINE